MESNLEKRVAELTTELLRLKTEFSDFESRRLSDLSNLSSRSSEIADSLRNKVKKSIDDIEGRRYPKWYVVDIPFSAEDPTFRFGQTLPKTSSVEIGGRPFVCTQMQSLYLITDQDVTHYPSRSYLGTVDDVEVVADGRSYPTTAYFSTITTLLYNFNVALQQNPATEDFLAYFFSEDPSAIPDATRYVGWSYPDFDFEIKNANSGRRWTDAKVPAAAFYSASGNPLFLAHSGIVDAYDRIEVTAHPTPRPNGVKSVNLAGIVKFVFFGYEIETTEVLSDTFGY